MTAAIVIGVVLAAAAAVAFWALGRQAATLDQPTDNGKGNGIQPSGSPAGVTVSIEAKDEMSAALANLAASLDTPPPVRAAAPVPECTGRCGANGPDGMQCDQPYGHDGARHEQDGYGWWTPAGAYPVAGWLP